MSNDVKAALVVAEEAAKDLKKQVKAAPKVVKNAARTGIAVGVGIGLGLLKAQEKKLGEAPLAAMATGGLAVGGAIGSAFIANPDAAAASNEVGNAALAIGAYEATRFGVGAVEKKAGESPEKKAEKPKS